MSTENPKPLMSITASRALSLFDRVRARYARPRAGYWPAVRLFYLRLTPGREASERVRDVYHVVKQPVPWRRALTVHINASASRFVERVVARAGRVVERSASPVTGTSELVYVIGPRSADGTAGTRAVSRLKASPGRVAELRTVYRTPEKLTKEVEGYSTAEPTIYDTGRGGHAAPSSPGPTILRESRLIRSTDVPVTRGSIPVRVRSPVEEPGGTAYVRRAGRYTGFIFPGEFTARKGQGFNGVPGELPYVQAAGSYPELVYRPIDVAGLTGQGVSGTPGEPPARTAPEETRAVYPAAGFAGDEGAASGRAAAPPALNYRDVTVNLDFDYLSERLFKMFERANEIAMERRGLI